MNHKELQKRKLLESVLEVMDGVIVSDEDDEIVYINQKYAELLAVEPVAVIGTNIRDLIPQTRMHIVTKTGQEEIGSIHYINETMPVVCNRLPIKRSGKTIGAVAFTTFRKMDELSCLLRHIDQLKLELKEYKNELGKLRGAKYSLEQMVGESPKIKELKETLKKVASCNISVLISGETGTGKELFAHALHQMSPRHYNSFIRLNCAAIPKDLLEAELFGYEEGAFTGAQKGGRAGKFELANGGSLLLDEINELPLILQSKLLRVIQEKEMERVGGNRILDLDVRLICTSNRDLKRLVQEGQFREDLYYRINAMELEVPPLRARLDDLGLLVDYFIGKVNRENGLNIEGIDKRVIKLFQNYDWPGNIRQLEHAIERASVMALSGSLGIEHFQFLLPNVLETESAVKPAGNTETLEKAKEEIEKQTIIRALINAKGNKKAAAQSLNIDRSSLYLKLKKHKIEL